jgi:predicted lipid-binding transport protein (Tim44 family)
MKLPGPAQAPSAANGSAAARAAGGPSARIEKLVVHTAGDAGAGARLAEALPDAIEAAVRAAAPGDEAELRTLIERAVREVAR